MSGIQNPPGDFAVLTMEMPFKEKIPRGIFKLKDVGT
jgi:hypothetical protein